MDGIRSGLALKKNIGTADGGVGVEGKKDDDENEEEDENETRTVHRRTFAIPFGCALKAGGLPLNLR
jgi:hypothetical protein